MGSLVRVRCRNCFESWSLRLGYGLAHGKIDPILPLFPEDTVKKLPLEKIQHHELPWSFAYEPAACEHCKALVAVPVLRLSADTEPISVPCPECSGSIKLLSEDHLSGTPCPACGAETLETTEQGLWD